MTDMSSTGGCDNSTIMNNNSRTMRQSLGGRRNLLLGRGAAALLTWILALTLRLDAAGAMEQLGEHRHCSHRHPRAHEVSIALRATVAVFVYRCVHG